MHLHTFFFIQYLPILLVLKFPWMLAQGIYVALFLPVIVTTAKIGE